ncbi:hypothetical protein GCM10007857_90360 [Bradyrhizobium iriomotense]|uniref:Transposase IS200-like domain-containing protein n=1 Tax=Bradyrhizobium iriomotense TaxID=441950 RepID=A0ABQ6BF35_9BRAD|nr:hypothetical protein GCM10007857_90360 [Bradyrhizobium iriomotense]
MVLVPYKPSYGDFCRTMSACSIVAKKFQVSARNAFALISNLGEDCAGAVQFVTHDRLEALKSGAGLWSPSYFAGSCGGAPLAIIAEYVQSQRQPRRPGEAFNLRRCRSRYPSLA